MTRSELLVLLNGKVLTGGRRTKAAGVREVIQALIDSDFNLEDDGTLLDAKVSKSGDSMTDLLTFLNQKGIDVLVPGEQLNVGTLAGVVYIGESPAQLRLDIINGTLTLSTTDGQVVISPGGIQMLMGINGLTTTPTEVQSNVDIEITDVTKGLIMTSPGGYKFRYQPNDSGDLVATSI